jgi:transaldolase
VAAAVLFFATSALLIDKFVYQESTSSIVTTTTNPALIEAEGYYMSLISQMSEEITTYGQNDYSDPQFKQDMNRLDSVYQTLKQDLVLGNEQSIVDAMIQNLQLRIEVLNNQLEIIQSIEQFKKEENESVNI